MPKITPGRGQRRERQARGLVTIKRPDGREVQVPPSSARALARFEGYEVPAEYQTPVNTKVDAKTDAKAPEVKAADAKQQGGK